MEYFQMFTDIIFGFIALFLITKVLGKTQITQITAFDFISALVLGELVGNALYDDEVSIVKIAFAVILWGILIYITEMITQKLKGSRSLLEGSPSLVIHEGKIMKKQLKKNKLDINQLQHLLRSKDVFSIKDVQFAVLETDGTISVLRRSDKQTPTKKDLNLPLSAVSLSSIFISDGEVLWDNLRESGFDESWLETELRNQHISRVDQVLMAEYTPGEQLFVMPY
ncbi:DUF421 domain-containing protein [Halobacillus shinanisalinarum]|uniref:DUF421 domain-containing protein n=1 Tax=Halobacillus shinanisalinarum TaxID=2932258 RepID=A0ABY4GXS0_9BACI|nr:DUF421 domain-containing protein [Halobacillus shinanisalinarum]UOQ92859.1 DUF421 domain-containing protein [Halobacillus shinanisalinarum]